jgi:anaerobic selenocysteine-containing dehydrogenase
MPVSQGGASSSAHSCAAAPRRTGTFHSICRLCGNRCPILVTLENGRAVKVTGNRDAAPYRGFTCSRGRALPELHNSPDRLLRPMKRLEDGTYQPISSEQALDEVAEAVRRLADRHGPSAIAMYFGTQGPQAAPNLIVPRAFFDALGSPMVFSANTIDQPGKQVAAGIHGYWLAPAQGFFEAEVALWIGINPLVSFKGIPTGVPIDGIAAIHARGGKTVVIDPRRTETARAASLHLQIKAGEDAAVLAGMIHLLVRDGLIDEDFVAANVDGFAELAAAVLPFTPELVARRAGIRVEDLETAARWFGEAHRGFAVAGTGVAMTAACGTLIEYLVLCLDTICGHYMREGEIYPSPSPLAPLPRFKAQAWPPVEAYGFGEVLRASGRADSLGGLQVADLPDEILYPGEGRVRALFNIGGNPIVAWPDQRRTLEALDALDLLVSFDVTMAQTSRRAHYVFASAMSLEMPGFQASSSATVGYANSFMGYLGPWAQYTPALADRPAGSDLLEEWEVFFELGKRLGLELAWNVKPLLQTGPPRPPREPVKMDMRRRPSHDEILKRLTQGSHVPLAKVMARPGGGFFPPPEPVRVAGKDQGWTGRLNVGDPHMMRDLAAMLADGGQEASAREFRLLNRRGIQINSSFNIASVNRGRFDNPLFVNPGDLAALGLDGGDEVEVASPTDSVRALVKADPSMPQGAVALAHCFGAAPGDEDAAFPGAAVNRLLSVEAPRDPYTGQPLMANVPVTIRAINRHGPSAATAKQKEVAPQ